jgi:hypothetical protein
VAPAFSASADFAIDKKAGQPCPNLQADFRCGVHSQLRQRGFTGCAVFDCFGAGQYVSQGRVRIGLGRNRSGENRLGDQLGGRARLVATTPMNHVESARTGVRRSEHLDRDLPVGGQGKGRDDRHR